jgi:dTDP-glucose 4,6-dehydratase
MIEKQLKQDLDHVLEHTGDVWKELSGARILLTGGTGFFGCWLVASFAWAKDRLKLQAELTVLSRDPNGFGNRHPELGACQGIHLVSGDVRTWSRPDPSFTHVIHAATPVDPRMNSERPFEVMDIIVQGTRNILDVARSSGAKRVLLTSSGAIYGRQPPELSHIPEDFSGGPDPADARSVYAEGKRAAEQLCVAFGKQYGIEAVIARGFAFMGPYLPIDGHLAAGNFIRDALKGQPITVNGDGTPLRSYLYGADLAIWLWTLLARGKSGTAFNLGSDQAISIRELAESVARAAGVQVKIAKPAATGLPERYVPSIEKARKELGLAPWISLEEGVQRTLQWHHERK